MLKKFALLFSLCLLSITTDASFVEKQLQYCHRQVLRSFAQLTAADGTIDYTRAPRNIAPGEDRWNQRSIKSPEEWTAGFWPGILWMDGDTAQAKRYTAELEYLAYRPIFDHDLGFIMIGSFLKGYETTHNEHYRQVLLAAADSLATLYNDRVGTLLSWPRNVGMFGGHNTIMDNMINLELLLWASEHGGSAHLRQIAISHADTTMRYHFRPDYSINHVAVYDPVTGRHLRNCNHQGLNDESLWSRGQSWAIYGFTMMYRYTHEARYLLQAERSVDAIIPLLPKDGIPYWDMRDPQIPVTYRDASAGAIIADALIELSSYIAGEKGKGYRTQARKMLTTLSSRTYQSRAKNPAFLMHSVGNYPAHSEIDYSINYADYYYLEALLRLRDNDCR